MSLFVFHIVFLCKAAEFCVVAPQDVTMIPVYTNALRITNLALPEYLTNQTWNVYVELKNYTTNCPQIEFGFSCTNHLFYVNYLVWPMAETNFFLCYHDDKEISDRCWGRMSPQTVTNKTDALRIASVYAARFGIYDYQDPQKWEHKMIHFTQGEWNITAHRILSNATERVYSNCGVSVAFYDDENSTLSSFSSFLFLTRNQPTNAVLTAAQGRANADALLARIGKWPATGAEFITNRLEFIQPNDIFVKPEGEDLNFDCMREERLIWCNYYSKQPEIPGWRKPQLPLLVYIDAVTGEVCGGSY